MILNGNYQPKRSMSSFSSNTPKDSDKEIPLVEVIYPEKQMAEWAAIRYSADHILDYVELDDEHAIFEISVPENWVGRTVGQLDIRNKHNINIMAFKHMGVMNLNIKSDTPVPENNTMLVLGNIRDIQKCFHI